MNSISQPPFAPSDEQVDRMFRQLDSRLRRPRRNARIGVVVAAALGIVVGGAGVAAYATQVVVPTEVAKKISQEELNAFAEAGGNAESRYLANEWGITPESAAKRLDALNAMGTFLPALNKAAGERAVNVSVVEGIDSGEDHIQIILTEGPAIEALEELAASIDYPIATTYEGTENGESIRATLNEIWPTLEKTYPELGNYLYDPNAKIVHLYYKGDSVSANAVATLAGVLPSYLSVVPEKYVSTSLSPMG